MDTAIHLDPSVRSFADLGPLRSPILLAGFSGPGGSNAVGAICYLAEAWDAQLIAEIDPDDFYDFTVARPVVHIEDGERVIEWPRARFWLAHPAGADRDVVLVDAREPNFRWRRFAEAILEVARALDVTETVVLASFAGGAPHTRELPRFLVGQRGAFAQRAGMPVRPPQYTGPAEASMAFSAHCREAGVTTTTLVAVAPFYLQFDPNPHAMRALVTTVDRGLGASTPLAALDAAITEVDERAATMLENTPDIAALVKNLERQIDESGLALPPPSLDVDEVLADVDAILRGGSDDRGHADSGGRPRRSAS